MNAKRRIEIFSAGCPACAEAIELVERLACSSCEVKVLDMKNPGVAEQAGNLGVRSVPAVAVNGRLAECCTGGPCEAAMRAVGLGQPIF